MSGLVLDAGVLIAIDRDDRNMINRVKAARLGGEPVRTNSMVLAQAWRDGKRQAVLAKAMGDIEVRPITGSAESR